MWWGDETGRAGPKCLDTLTLRGHSISAYRFQRHATRSLAYVPWLELSTIRDTLICVDHASEARQVQISRFRQMTPGERWGAARDLYWTVRRLKEAFVHQQHPDWSNDQVAAAVIEAFSHVRD